MEEFTMPMHMGFRWYGEGNDAIKLSDIKQIPGVTSIVWATVFPSTTSSSWS